MHFDQAYLEFDRYLTYVETLALNTRRGYMRRTEELNAYLVDLGYRDTTEITADLVADFMADTYTARADSTYNLYAIQVRRFLKFLREERLLGDDQAPERKLKGRKRPMPLREKKFVHVEDVAALAEKGAEWHIRDKYLILAMSGLARRAMEICTMNVGDVDLNPRGNAKWGVFRFTNAKTHRVRFLPIQEHVAESLQEWLEDIYPKLLRRDVDQDRELLATDPLFPALQRGKGASYRGMRDPQVINPNKRLPYGSLLDALTRAGADDSHSLRRGMLVSIKERFGIRAAKIYADHAEELTTEAYMDQRREVDDLGKLLTEESRDNAKKARKKAAKAAAKAGVPSLKDRRAKALRAS